MFIDYITNYDNTTTQAIVQWAELLLPPSWLKNIHQSEDRERYVLGRMLLYRRLTVLGYDYTTLPEMKYTLQGKPFFEDSVHFNIAYSAGIILVGVSTDFPLGVDVETIRPISWQSYEQYFTAEEWLKIARGPHPTRDLIGLWVAKEAANKLKGEPSLKIEDVRIRFRTKRMYLNREKFYHKEIELPSQFVAKAVTQTKVKNYTVQDVTPQLTSSSMLYVRRA